MYKSGILKTTLDFKQINNLFGKYKSDKFLILIMYFTIKK